MSKTEEENRPGDESPGEETNQQPDSITDPESSSTDELIIPEGDPRSELFVSVYDDDLRELGIYPAVLLARIRFRTMGNDDKVCTEALGRMARATGISYSTVKRAIKKLEEHGKIIVRRRSIEKSSGGRVRTSPAIKAKAHAPLALSDPTVGSQGPDGRSGESHKRNLESKNLKEESVVVDPKIQEIYDQALEIKGLALTEKLKYSILSHPEVALHNLRMAREHDLEPQVVAGLIQNNNRYFPPSSKKPRGKKPRGNKGSKNNKPERGSVEYHQQARDKREEAEAALAAADAADLDR